MGTHDGHRARLREIFHNAGVSGLTEVNMLELLLFYALPRRDTNPIAHRLIDRFGTLEAVFETDMDTLMTVEGVGESAATLLRLTGELHRRLSKSSPSRGVRIVSAKDAIAYFERFMLDLGEERCYAAYLDGNMKVIASRLVASGSINTVPIVPAAIARTAVDLRAHAVIIAHNHVNAPATASIEDVNTTRKISDRLAALDIELKEHVIVSKSGSRTVGEFAWPVYSR